MTSRTSLRPGRSSVTETCALCYTLHPPKTDGNPLSRRGSLIGFPLAAIRLPGTALLHPPGRPLRVERDGRLGGGAARPSERRAHG